MRFVDAYEMRMYAHRLVDQLPSEVLGDLIDCLINERFINVRKSDMDEGFFFSELADNYERSSKNYFNEEANNRR